MSLLPYKALWGNPIAFTFSEELGLEEGGHVWILSPQNLYLLNILAVWTPLSPFMVEWHLGKLIFVTKYTDLGLFVKSCLFL